MINQNFQKDKNIKTNSKYCTQDVGISLYSDNMASIERTQIIGDIFRIFAFNKDIDENIIKKLDEYKRKDAFHILTKINELKYSKEYLDFLYDCKENQEVDSIFNFREGILDKGYFDKTNNIYYSKDLRPSIELTLIWKDFQFPVVCRENKLYRGLGYIQSNFIFNKELKNNSLVIGLDLGYLFFNNKEKDITVYVYDIDKEYIKFFKKNILDKMNSKLNVIFLEDLDNINNLNMCQIIIDNTQFFETYFKIFYNDKLYNYIDIIESDSLKIIMNKLKMDFRTLIFSSKEEFCDSILENYKDFKGIECSIAECEIDFIEKCERFLDSNKIFYDSYKKFQKDLNKDEFFINILKNY